MLQKKKTSPPRHVITYGATQGGSATRRSGKGGKSGGGMGGQRAGGIKGGGKRKTHVGSR
jgi:hypothetical protein